MKTQLQLTALALLLSTINSQVATTFAQGSLTPPGAPAPTMKTLAQIEPRTPIASAPFTISVAGSYYLTTNLTVSSGDAITIAANNVTLDLNGFTIASTRAIATTDSAILLSGGRTDVAIYNGHISSGVTNTAAGVFGGGGFGYGIFYSGNAPANVRVKAVSVADVLNYGIVLGTGSSTVVEACTVNVAGSYGIYADSVADSTAVNCGNYGIYASTAHNCVGSSAPGWRRPPPTTVPAPVPGAATGCLRSPPTTVTATVSAARGCMPTTPRSAPVIVRVAEPSKPPSPTAASLIPAPTSSPTNTTCRDGGNEEVRM